MKHPHADLIKQMVDDDTLRAECRQLDGDWPMSKVAVMPSYDWCLVPPKPKTITIVCNGKTYELPEPMRVAPDMGSEYFTTNSEDATRWRWSGNSYEIHILESGRCHATREAAQQWVTAMAEIRGAK